MSGIPCPHACVVIKAKHGNIYEFVDDCYKSTRLYLIYSFTMVLVETHNMLDITMLESPCIEFPLTPPVTKRPRRRLKMKCIKSQFIILRKIQCSKCKQLGTIGQHADLKILRNMMYVLKSFML